MSSTGALPIKSESSNSSNVFPIIITLSGVFAVITGMIVQFFVINNGSSGDNIIMGNMRSIGPIIGTSISCLFIGLLLWKSFNQSSKSFLWLFILTMISYFLANMAIMFSLYQVELKKQ
jgi:hypothetical protein